MDSRNQWHPSWDKWGIVPIVVLIVIPVTFGIIKFIEEWYHRDTEIKLAELTEKREIRLKYLTIALQPYKSDEQSKQALRFLVNIEDDTMLSRWAKKELKTVSERMAAGDTNKRKLDLAFQTISDLQYTVNLLNRKDVKHTKESQKQIYDLEGKLLAANKEKDDLLRKRSDLYITGIPSSSFSPYSGITAGSLFVPSNMVWDSSKNSYVFRSTIDQSLFSNFATPKADSGRIIFGK